MQHFVNKLVFNGEELLATYPTSKLENHLISAVCDCLYNIFAATLHFLEAVFSIHDLRMCHVMVTGTCITWL